MIETPSQFTPVHEEEIYDDGKLQSFSEEFYKKLGANNNWLVDLRPVGTVIFINVNQLGGGVPAPSLFQQCDGSEIVNPNSPLRSIGVNKNYTPNMKDRYVRFTNSVSGNPQGGTQNHNLKHAHSTGMPSAVGPGLEKKGDRRYRVPHTHHISEQYDNPTRLDSPAYIYLIPYMKIV